MKIGMIFTGGTIGSTVDQSGYISTMKRTPFLLLEMYREKVRADIEFVTDSPYRILSENLSGEDLTMLIASVRKMIVEQNPEGIIVTHGTDTLQYSAAVLGYVFADCKIPIVLVSSNYVLQNEMANGLSNLKWAIRFMEERRGTGVFVSYSNQGDNPVLHLGTRLQPPLFYSDEVASIEDSWFGRYVDGEYQSNGKCFLSSKSAVMFEEGEEVHLSDATGKILCIHPFVGMKYPVPDTDVKAVLHGSFHSGTIAVNGELEHFAKVCQESKIPFYLIGLSSHVTSYETVKAYQKLGITPLYDTAWIAQYCKLWLLLDNGKDVDLYMKKSVGQDWNNELG